MPTKTNSKSKKSYYQKHKKYREELIEKTTAKHKANKEKYAKEQREYYANNESYREYKKKYAAKYRREEPIKSRARKYRGRVK